MSASTLTPASAVNADARAEFAFYEGIRDGRREPFAAFAVALDPVLRDLAAALTPDRRLADALVRHAWEVALGGLDVFAWRSSLRAWVAGALAPPVAGHSVAFPATLATGAADLDGGTGTPAGAGRSGPADWIDLPWGRRWAEGTWEALERARAGMPAGGRQALVLRDAHGWCDRDACDSLGLTEARYRIVLAGARLALHDALVPLAADPPPACAHDRLVIAATDGAWKRCAACATLAARLGRVATLLAATAARPPSSPDPALLAVFRRWRAARRGGLAGWLARRRR